MSPKWKERLFSVEWWTKVFSAPAALGLLLLLVGHAAKVKTLILLGLGLGAPLVALAVLLWLVGVPLALISRGRHAKR